MNGAVPLFGCTCVETWVDRERDWQVREAAQKNAGSSNRASAGLGRPFAYLPGGFSLSPGMEPCPAQEPLQVGVAALAGPGGVVA